MTKSKPKGKKHQSRAKGQKAHKKASKKSGKSHGSKTQPKAHSTAPHYSSTSSTPSSNQQSGGGFSASKIGASKHLPSSNQSGNNKVDGNSFEPSGVIGRPKLTKQVTKLMDHTKGAVKLKSVKDLKSHGFDVPSDHSVSTKTANTGIRRAKRKDGKSVVAKVITLAQCTPRYKVTLEKYSLKVMRFVGRKPPLLPCFPRIYDIFLVEHKQYYIFMDDYGNKSVYDHLTGGKHPISAATVRNWLRQLVEAVKQLQVHGIAHRFIKLKHLLLVDTHQLKLVGWAKSVLFWDPHKRKALYQHKERRSRKNNFLPPEAFRQLYDPSKADVWSIGVVLVALTTGRYPFHVRARVKFTTQWRLFVRRHPMNPIVRSLCNRVFVLNTRKRVHARDMLTHNYFRVEDGQLVNRSVRGQPLSSSKLGKSVISKGSHSSDASASQASGSASKSSSSHYSSQSQSTPSSSQSGSTKSEVGGSSSGSSNSSKDSHSKPSSKPSKPKSSKDNKKNISKSTKKHVSKSGKPKSQGGSHHSSAKPKSKSNKAKSSGKGGLKMTSKSAKSSSVVKSTNSSKKEMDNTLKKSEGKSTAKKSSGSKLSKQKSSGSKLSGQKSSVEKSSVQKSSGEKSSIQKSSVEKSSLQKTSGEKSSVQKSSGSGKSIPATVMPSSKGFDPEAGLSKIDGVSKQEMQAEAEDAEAEEEQAAEEAEEPAMDEVAKDGGAEEGGEVGDADAEGGEGADGQQTNEEMQAPEEAADQAIPAEVDADDQPQVVDDAAATQVMDGTAETAETADGGGEAGAEDGEAGAEGGEEGGEGGEGAEGAEGAEGGQTDGDEQGTTTEAAQDTDEAAEEGAEEGVEEGTPTDITQVKGPLAKG